MNVTEFNKEPAIYKNLSLTNLPGEIWRDIPGFEGKYHISNMGRVKVLNRQNTGQEKIMEQQLNRSNGRYLMIQLYKNNRPYTFTVHRLVGIVFIPNSKNYPELNHRFGIKIDNRATELEWCTRLQNIRHAYRNLKMNRGLNNHNSKFSNQDIIDIFYSHGTHREIARKYGVAHTVIGNIKRKNSYKAILNGLNQ